MANEQTPLLNTEGNQRTYVDILPSSAESNKTSLVTINQLFRFTDRTDSVLLALAVTGSIIYGIVTPTQFIIFGKMVNDFVEYIVDANYRTADIPDLEASTTKTAVYYVLLAIGNLVFAWLGMGLFALSAERQVHKMRLAMFQSVIYQNIGWFETFSVGELNTRFTEQIKVILDGIGSKFSRIISSVVCFVAAYITGFVLCWDLTLILLASFPLMMLCGIFITKLTGVYTSKELNAFGKAGKIAQQSISSIKTVAALGGERHQVKLYDERLEEVCKYAVKKGISFGLGMAAFQIVLYANYGISVWYIIKLARTEVTRPGDALAVFFAVTMGSMILGQTAGTCFEALFSARGAAFVVFETIDQESEIDASSPVGEILENVNGSLEFSHVKFAYPRRPTVQVLRDFTLKIPSGKCVALVGESGSGKSTIRKLLQRFYDPDGGCILLDNHDIRSLNISNLRSYIAVVNQEPFLMSTTIAKNIAFNGEDVTQHEIENAAKIANAHDFILRFPKGYNTLCGERGTQMSGGQKQRIAIARALVRNPKILLLDEATSALDSENEVIVQEAIRKAGEGRTTIIIAHRLSTIRNADVIAVVNEGHVAEIGTHEELMALDGLYSSLVKLQANCDDDISEDGSSFEGDQYFQISDDGAHKLASVVSSIAETQAKTTLILDNMENHKPVSFARILKWNAPEWKFLVLGCIGAALYGAYPFLYGIAFGGVLYTMRYNPIYESEAMERDAKHWAVFFFLIGLESGVGIFLQNWCFSSAGEALTRRLRKSAFSAFLRQDLTYFDNPQNSTGVICSRLATEVSSIQGATVPQLGLVASALVTVIGGLVVAFSASWRLTLSMMAFIPIVLIAATLINYFLRANDCDQVTAGYVEVIEESFSNIETIASFNRESECIEKHHQAALLMHRKGKKSSHYIGIMTGTLIAIINLSFAVAFRLGGYLVVHKDVTIRDMMKSIFTVILSTIVLGQVSSVTPDYGKAKRAANKLFRLLQRIPLIDSYTNDGKKPDQCHGDLSLSNVNFRYRTRPKYKVLRNFHLTVTSGQTVALVGTSGCGKTTLLSLIPRLYDVNIGCVVVDGIEIKDLNLKWLRSQIAIVSQEPVLFDMTIRDNIAYPDAGGNITDKEIIDAAKLANIHKFIMTLPKGYDTNVGDKGTFISGGQKQRIAIARALIRDPKILLLDEATSALDRESEKMVQRALQKACARRTTIIIAHHLSTIQNADKIIVMRKGKVAECGTHNELLATKGIYYSLYKAQALARRPSS